MQKFLAPASLAWWTLFSSVALAQGTDVTYPSGAGSGAGAAVVGVGMVFLILYLAFLVFCFVVWIKMLIHAAKHAPADQKALWIILIVFTGIIGAAIYYFMVKRPMDKGSKTTNV